MGPVVTISASYGAGGSVVAPGVADRLGLPLVDRLVSANAAEAPALHVSVAPSGEGISKEEELATPASRFLSYLAHVAPVGATVTPPIPDVGDDDDLRLRAEAAITEVRYRHGGVVLGRAAAVVLRGEARAYHVRLDGPESRRIEQAARLEGIDEERAKQRMAETDRARTAYVRRLYRTDPTDPRLYHLIIDSTAVDLHRVIGLVVMASRGALGIE